MPPKKKKAKESKVPSFCSCGMYCCPRWIVLLAGIVLLSLCVPFVCRFIGWTLWGAIIMLFFELVGAIEGMFTAAIFTRKNILTGLGGRILISGISCSLMLAIIVNIIELHGTDSTTFGNYESAESWKKGWIACLVMYIMDRLSVFQTLFPVTLTAITMTGMLLYKARNIHGEDEEENAVAAIAVAAAASRGQ